MDLPGPVSNEQLVNTLAMMDNGINVLRRGTYKGDDVIEVAKFLLFLEDFEKNLKVSLDANLTKQEAPIPEGVR